jgi:hypothetical protein
MPLTELIINQATDTKTAQINLYVSLLDMFGSPIKTPGVFRLNYINMSSVQPTLKAKDILTTAVSPAMSE